MDENPTARDHDGIIEVVVDEHGRMHVADALLFTCIVLALPWLSRVAYGALWPSLASASPVLAAFLGGGLVVVVGGLFFRFRARARRLYGAAEIALAVVIGAESVRALRTAAHAGQGALEARGLLITLAGAKYLMVRGLDNWSQGNRIEVFRKVPLSEGLAKRAPK